MTVVSLVITMHGTAHASDSFLTVRQADGTLQVVETQQPKLVAVRSWRGAMAYWGLARLEPNMSTFDWLRQQARRASEQASPEAFAQMLAEELTTATNALKRRQFVHPENTGLGIHFTAYERVKDYWIPELFQIRNWTDESYRTVRPEGFVVTRETFGALQNEPRTPAHGQPDHRLTVHDALHNGVLLYFNNGDPALFNPVANSVFKTFQELLRRRVVRDPLDLKTHAALVRRPIELISRLLGDFCVENSRAIGGALHDLCIAPDGTYYSTCGDCKP
jgi:hypothetical protein